MQTTTTMIPVIQHWGTALPAPTDIFSVRPHAPRLPTSMMTRVQQIVGGSDFSAASEPLTLTPC